MENDWKKHALGFTLGAIATCGASTFSNPFEVVKTRLQLQGELKTASPYRGATHAFWTIFKTEGLRGIQKGLIPGYSYQFIMNGARFGTYEPLKKILGDHGPVLLIAGALSGSFGAFLASPLFLIKTRMQSFSDKAPKVGHQHDYIHRGVLYSIRHIYQHEGLKGLWRGADAAMVRTAVGSGVQLSTYDSTKRWLIQFPYFPHDSVMTHFSASLMTSFFVCLAMNPFDVIMTRMYNQSKGSLYKNPFDCFAQTLKMEGPMALFKGAGAHYMRIGPHTVLTFVFLEQLRSFFKWKS